MDKIKHSLDGSNESAVKKLKQMIENEKEKRKNNNNNSKGQHTTFEKE